MSDSLSASLAAAASLITVSTAPHPQIVIPGPYHVAGNTIQNVDGTVDTCVVAEGPYRLNVRLVTFGRNDTPDHSGNILVEINGDSAVIAPEVVITEQGDNFQAVNPEKALEGAKIHTAYRLFKEDADMVCAATPMIDASDRAGEVSKIISLAIYTFRMASGMRDKVIKEERERAARSSEGKLSKLIP